MNRFATSLFAVALAVALLGSTGCQRKVDVQTGTRTVCTYGEVISDNSRTIKVAEKDAGNFRVQVVTKTCDRHLKLESLYTSAQADITRGDLASAQKTLAVVVAGDPGFKKAKAQLDQIVARKKPAPDGASPATPAASTPATTPAGTAQEPVGPVESLLKWTPDSLPGLKPAAKASGDSVSVTREYVPVSDSNVVQCVVVAEQFRNSSAAKDALASQIKMPYGTGSGTVAVNGRDAYFGMSGQRYAIIAFTQGPVLVAVEMFAKPGKQADLKAPLTAAARALP